MSATESFFFLAMILVHVYVTNGFDRGRICQFRCSRGMGGALCQCSSAHFAGKRSGHGDFTENNLINNAIDMSEAYFDPKPLENTQPVFVLSPVSLNDDASVTDYFSTNPPREAVSQFSSHHDSPNFDGTSLVQNKGLGGNFVSSEDAGFIGAMGNIPDLADDSYSVSGRSATPNMLWARLPLLVFRDRLLDDPSRRSDLKETSPQNNQSSVSPVKDKRFSFLLRKMLNLHGGSAHPVHNTGGDTSVVNKRYSHLLRQMLGQANGY